MEFSLKEWDIQESDFLEGGKIDVQTSIKRSLMTWLDSLDLNEVAPTSQKTVQLFHGTTTAHLGNILELGLLPRKETNNNNWKNLDSHSNVVYVTNKWHYYYAYRVTDKHLVENGLKNGLWWQTWESMPCYIECQVPVEYLVPDEDFTHSKYVSNKIKSAIKKHKPLNISAGESLLHYGTAGVLGGIPKEWITSFSVLAEPEMYAELYLNKNSPYAKDVAKWGVKGQGKGKVSLMDLWKREDKSTKNATFLMQDMPKNKKILQIGMNPKTNNLAIVFDQ